MASAGSASAISTAGNVASRPNAFVFRTTEPASTPSSTATFQAPNKLSPQVQTRPADGRVALPQRERDRLVGGDVRAD